MSNWVVPFPVPLAPDVTVIQLTPLDAVHVQPAAVVTVIAWLPPRALIATVVGETRNAQPPGWLIVKVWSAIVNTPDRPLDVLAATVKLTVPLPVPLAPCVIVTHDAVLAAVHAQPAPAVTVTLPEPPPAAILVLCGAMAKLQPLPWFTVKVWPPIVSVPVRGPPVVEAAA
jgi:hypothetical protein